MMKEPNVLYRVVATHAEKQYLAIASTRIGGIYLPKEQYFACLTRVLIASKARQKIHFGRARVNKSITQKLCKQTRKVATATRCRPVDLHTAFDNKCTRWNKVLLPLLINCIGTRTTTIKPNASLFQDSERGRIMCSRMSVGFLWQPRGVRMCPGARCYDEMDESKSGLGATLLLLLLLCHAAISLAYNWCGRMGWCADFIVDRLSQWSPYK